MNITMGHARQLASDLLTAAGLPPERAEVTARCIVLADVWGIGSHGLLRLPYYLRRTVAGGYPPRAELTTRVDTGPLVALDGGGGLGHWQLHEAAQLLVERVRQFGVAAVSLANSGHCGALGIYTLPGVTAGHLVMVFSNGPAVMPAWGGAKPILSTSPLAAGIPTRPRPAIVDMATSAVARGKIAARANAGVQVPEGWALDTAGQPTTDPDRALHGLLAPLGGAKGFALAFLVESLAGGLAGPNLSTGVPDMFTADDDALPQRIGHVLVAFDTARFGDSGATRDRLDRLAASVTDSGGRLPGSRRTPESEVDEDLQLDIADTTMTELHRWVDRLATRPSPA